MWVKVHPFVVRVTHWINVLAVLIMVFSGWRIYNASPLFASLYIPDWLTLGGWLAGALQWHFAALWLFAVNGLVYLVYGIVSGHFRRKLLPISPRAVLHDIGQALRGRLAHEDLSGYNAAQRAAYVALERPRAGLAVRPETPGARISRERHDQPVSLQCLLQRRRGAHRRRQELQAAGRGPGAGEEALDARPALCAAAGVAGHAPHLRRGLERDRQVERRALLRLPRTDRRRHHGEVRRLPVRR